MALLQKQNIQGTFNPYPLFLPQVTLWVSDFPGTFSGYMTNNLISLLHAHS